MFTVQVIDKKKEKPVRFAIVDVVFRGWRKETGWYTTNRKGEIDFEHRSGHGKVYIKTGIWSGSQIVYEGEISGRVVVYV